MNACAQLVRRAKENAFDNAAYNEMLEKAKSLRTAYSADSD